MNSKDIAVVAVFAMACILAIAFQLRPVFRAWGRRLEGGVVDEHVSHELAELRERVAELEAGRAHLSELEERLDFAERLLARRDDVTRLPVHRTPV